MPWAAPIITVSKKEPTGLHLKIHQYSLPKTDDQFASLAGGEKFTITSRQSVLIA